MQLGWGVVGLGRIVSTVIAPAMQIEPACRLVAGASRRLERAKAFREKFDADRAYDSYEAMLEDPDIDAVYIATPNGLHAEQVVAAARAGKHVLCDKPLAITVKDAVTAVEACAKAGVRLGVTFHFRHMPWVQHARELIATDTIGEIIAIDAQTGAGPTEPTDWRADPELAGLGTVYSHGVHGLDAIGYLLRSEPKEVMAMFDPDAPYRGVETQALAMLRYDNGTLVQFNTNQRYRHARNDMAIYGSKGRILALNLTRTTRMGELHVRTEDGETSREFPNPGAHQRCVAAFTSAVLDDREPEPSGVDGLASTVLCEAIATSAREGRRTAVDSPAH